MATIRALKMHGGVKKDALGTPDVAALKRGWSTSRRHVRNVQKFGVPVVVAVNRFLSDTARGDRRRCSTAAKSWGARVALSDVWAKGGAGGEAVANEVLAVLDEKKGDFKPIYDAAMPIKEKIETIAPRDLRRRRRRLHRRVAEQGDRADRGHGARRDPGLHGQDAVLLQRRRQPSSAARPASGSPIRDVYASAGAGFVVALAGDIMTMPGLAKTPAAEQIRVLPDGTIEGLF